MNPRIRKLTVLAVLSAMAYAAVFFIRIPFIPAVSFLKYEPKDIIITIGGFLFGPMSAAAMSVVVSFIEMFTISETGYYGLIMNVVSSCAFACTASLIYKKNRTLKGALVGLTAGWLTAVGIMMLWNYIITPIYLKIPRDFVVPLLIPGFLPFNLIKYGLNAAAVLLVYKPLSLALRRANVIQNPYGSTGRINTGIILVSLFAMVTGVLLMLVYKGVI